MRMTVELVDARRCVVMARREDDGDVEWRDGATFGGAIVRGVTIPRAIAKDGSPRFDLFGIVLAPGDAKRLKEGDVVDFLPRARPPATGAD